MLRYNETKRSILVQKSMPVIDHVFCDLAPAKCAFLALK